MTTKDIARICGVSVGSVDRALNSRAGISPRTKERILRVSRELRYRPHMAARHLATGRSMAIGLVMFHLEHPALVQVATAAMHRGRETGYFVHLAVSDRDLDVEREHFERLASLNVDGFLVMTAGGSRTFDQYLASLQRPIVVMGSHRTSRWCTVGIDERQASYDAACAAIEAGYRRLIYVSPELSAQGVSSYSIELRYRGFREAVSARLGDDRPTILRDGAYLDHLKSLAPFEKRTAIMCAGDFFALEVLSLLRDQHVAVPSDVGLMGFGKADFIRFVCPLLTTVDYHAADMAHKAVDSLLSLIAGNQTPSAITIGHRLVPGETL